MIETQYPAWTNGYIVSELLFDQQSEKMAMVLHSCVREFMIHRSFRRGSDEGLHSCVRGFMSQEGSLSPNRRISMSLRPPRRHSDYSESIGEFLILNIWPFGTFYIVPSLVSSYSRE